MYYSGNPAEDYAAYIHDEEKALKNSGHYCDNCEARFFVGSGGMWENETRSEFCEFCYRNFRHVYYLRDKFPKLKICDIFHLIENMREI